MTTSSHLPEFPGFQAVSVSADRLAVGDRLLRLGGIGFAQLRDPNADPVIVADLRPPLTDVPPQPTDDNLVEITTSAGTLYTRLDAPALALRDDTVTSGTVLLISRRAALHSSLLGFGVPIVRRNPVTASRTAPAVTLREWQTAPLIVIDGYLSRTTIREMWRQGGLPDRNCIVMVATDPDEVRVYERQQAAKARYLALLPYDKATLSDLFRSAINAESENSPYLGILTPGTPDQM